MPELPKKKVGIVACSGEEMAQGTVTRLAALKVLETLRPSETVTICLPLFLAGGQGDRAFARFYPTIAIDGCDKRCAARATEMFSGKPAASIVVDEVLAENGAEAPQGRRRLDAAGIHVVDLTADRVAAQVDELLGKRWSRTQGALVAESEAESVPTGAGEARCSCASAIPSQKLLVGGRVVKVLGLPLIFEQFKQDGRTPDAVTISEMLETVRVYNPVDDEDGYRAALLAAYAVYWAA